MINISSALRTVFSFTILILSSSIYSQTTAIQFDGIDDYVEIPDHSSLDVVGDLTLECMVKVAGANGSQVLLIKTEGGLGTDMSYALRISAQNKFRFEIGDGVSIGTVLADIPAYNQWVHLAGVFDSSAQTIRIYVDGTLANTESVSLNSLYSSNASVILGEFPGFNQEFEGYLDEVRIWSVARSATEILENKDAEVQGTETGLSAYYRMNDGAGSVLTDNSSNTNNGTLYNFINAWANNCITPFIDLGDDIITCANSVTITAQLADHYQWSTGEATQTISVTQSGDYSVLVDNSSSNTLHLNSYGDYVRVPFDPSMQPTAEITLSLWARSDDWTASEYTLFSNTQGAGYNLGEENGVLKLNIRRNGSYGPITIDPSTLTAGWHHFTATFDGQITTFYVDGISMGTSDAGAVYPIQYHSGNLDVLFGAEQTSSNNPEPYEYFVGHMDNIQIWSRALSASEVVTYMNQSPSGTETNLEIFYDFEEGTGTTAIDHSINGNDGNFVGAVYDNSTISPVIAACNSSDTIQVTIDCTDTDCDGALDFEEIAQGTDPYDNESYQSQTQELVWWDGVNTSTATFPVAGINESSLISSSEQDYFGLIPFDDSRNFWSVPSSSTTIDINSTAHLEFTVMTNSITDFDRFVIHGAAPFSSSTQVQLRWSVDDFSSSLGNFTPGGTGYNLTSIDLSSQGFVDAGEVKFRIYYYGTGNLFAHSDTGPYSSLDGTPASYTSYNRCFSIWGEEAPVSVSSTETVSTCDSYDWNGETYTESGTYSHVFEGSYSKYNSMGFDGVNDYLTVSNPANMPLNNFTISADVKVITPAQGNRIINYGHDGNNQGGWLLGINNNNTLRFYIDDNNSDWKLLTSTSALTTGEWHSISATYDGAQMKLYIDGALDASVNETGIVIAQSPSVLNIARSTYSGPEWYGGSVDNVQVWDSALDENTIASNSTCPPVGSEDGLVAFYDFENVSSTVSDLSGSGNHLSIVGATPSSDSQLYACQQECDSIALLDLTILESTAYIQEVTACDSYDWNGQIITVSGDYDQTITNVAGCDSILTLTVTINNSSTGASSISACDSYNWNGQIITASGDYTQTFENAAGCDSVHTLTATIDVTPDVELGEDFHSCDASVLLGDETWNSDYNYCFDAVENPADGGWNHMGNTSFMNYSGSTPEYVQHRTSSANGKTYTLNRRGDYYYLREFTETGWTTVWNIHTGSNHSYESIALELDNNGIPHIAYTYNQNSSNMYARVSKYENGVMNTVATLNGYFYVGLDLAFDNNNLPYLAIQKTYPYKSSVYKKSGSGFSLVGAEDFTNMDCRNMTLDFDSNNIPYMIVNQKSSPTNWNASSHQAIYTYQNGSWGFYNTYGTNGFGDIKKDLNGDLIYVYSGQGQLKNLSNGNSNIGPSLTHSTSVKIDFNSENTPYAAFLEGTKLSVENLVDGVWEEVGNAQFSNEVSSNPTYYRSFEVFNDTPIICYRESTNPTYPAYVDFFTPPCLGTTTYEATLSDTYIITANNNECYATDTISLTFGTPTIDTLSVTSCDNYEWLGTTYTSSGLYSDTLTNASGCDSVITLDLTLGSTPTINLAESISICEDTVTLSVPLNSGESYCWNPDYVWGLLGGGAPNNSNTHLENTHSLRTDAYGNIYVIAGDIDQIWQYNGTSWSHYVTIPNIYNFPTSDLDFTLHNGELFIATHPVWDSFNEVTLRKYDGSSWTTIQTLSAGAFNNVFGTFEQSSAGDLVYSYTLPNGNAAIYNYNGSTFDQLGLSIAGGTYSSICFDDNNNPVVSNGSGKVFVFDSTVWSEIGTGLGNGTKNSLHADADGNIYYVSSSLFEQNGEVYMYDGLNSWTQLGSTFNGYVSELVSGNGELVVSVTPTNNQSQLHRFNGTDWEGFGDANSSPDGYPPMTGDYLDGEYVFMLSLHDSFVDYTIPSTVLNSSLNTCQGTDNTFLASIGTNVLQVSDAVGCLAQDTTIVIQLPSSSSIDAITACDEYTWIDGVTYTESNSTATHTLVAANGCDSIVTLDLTINNSYEASFNMHTCDSYEWEGITYTESGIYTETYTRVNGCDSILTLNLSLVYSTESHTYDASYSTTYTWNGSTYDATGEYTYGTWNLNECDSTAYLHLTMLDNPFAESPSLICENDAALSFIEGENEVISGTNNLVFDPMQMGPGEHTLTADYNTSGGYVLDQTGDFGFINIDDVSTDITPESPMIFGGMYAPLGFEFEAAGVTCESIAFIDGLVAPFNEDTEEFGVQILTNFTDFFDSNFAPWVFDDQSEELITFIKYATVGSAPNRIFVLETDSAPAVDNDGYFYSAQLHIHEANNAIEIHTQELDGIGLELPFAQGLIVGDFNDIIIVPGREGIEGDPVELWSVTDDYVAFIPQVAVSASVSHTITVNPISEVSETVTACDSYDWNGNTYTESGIYDFITDNYLGCDSITTLDLTVNYSTTSITDITACDQYSWNGMFLTESGSYTYSTLNSVGCDSTATLNLTITNNVHSFSDTGCDSYEWNGTEYNTSGTYEYVYEAANGCDSTVFLDLTILESSSSITYITSCNSYTWNGVEYDEEGAFDYNTTNAAGCDSTATLILTLYHDQENTESATACGSYEWRGNTYTASGTYVNNTFTDFGCALTETLELTINNSSSSVEQVTECGSYEWNGNVYNESGVYEYNSTNIYGCDSTATLILNINNSSESLELHTACDSYEWNGTEYTESGTYTYETTNSSGCDHVETLVLTIYYSEDSTETITACDSYEWNGTVYTESGLYTNNTTTDLGCPWVQYLDLTILESTSSTESVTQCDSYEWNDVVYDASGTYTYETTNVAGCDSTATLVLTITSSSNSTTHHTECDSYEWHGVTYTESGIYTYLSANAEGCTHTETLVLTIYYSEDSTEEVTACDSYEWNGVVYTESGLYTNSTTTDLGCPWTQYLDLTITNSTASFESITECDSYFWNGVEYISTGVYTYNTVNAAGCDSTATLLLTINSSSEVTEMHSACDSFEWNGTVYTESGTYTHQSINDHGCTLTETLVLTVNYSENSTETVTACNSYIWHGTEYTEDGVYSYFSESDLGCPVTEFLDLTLIYSTSSYESVTACGSYFWNGVEHNTSGIYDFFTTNAAGCDSTATLDLTINYPSESLETITTCDSYEWNGQVYTETGAYTHESLNADGCTHISTLDLTIYYSATTTEEIVACDSYEWNGEVYTESGTFTYETTNGLGCPWTQILELTINNSSSSFEERVECDSYLWNGIEYNTSGIYNYYTTNFVGCDSTATIDLTINYSTESLEHAEVCDSYEWNGEVYTETGTYTNETTNEHGCTHIETLILEVNYSQETTEIVEACDSYVWHGMLFTESGEYSYTTTTEFGCTWVQNLDLTINYSSESYEERTECDSYEWNDIVYVNSGIYYYNTTNAAGCDSTATLVLTMNYSTESTEYHTDCDSYEWNGEEYTETGTYTFVSENEMGCTHTSTLVLEINESLYTTDEVTSCDSFEWNGDIYTESGTYIYETTTELGCPWIQTLELTINHSTESYNEVVECDEYLWNGITYNTSGTYTFMTTNYMGCDSIATLDLTINYSPPVPIIEHIFAATLSVTNMTYSSYTWFLDGVMIEGELSSTLNITEAGVYSVVVTAGEGCGTWSEDFPIGVIGIDNIENYEFSLYPNPTRGYLMVETPIELGAEYIIEMYDACGRRVYFSNRVDATVNHLDVSSLAQGMYHLVVRYSDGKVWNEKVIIK